MTTITGCQWGEPVLLTMPGPFRTLGQIIQANEASGQCYFGANSLAAWESVIPHRVYGGRLFVEAVHHPVYERLYRVRAVTDDGTVVNVCELWKQESPTRADYTEEQMLALAQECAAQLCYQRGVHPDAVDDWAAV